MIPVVNMGTDAIFDVTFTRKGNLVDPNTVTCKVRDPQGNVTGADPTRLSVGTYEVIVNVPVGPLSAGTWTVRVEGTGSYTGASPDFLFTVPESEFYQ